MPDLGKYEVTVLSAYGAAIFLIVALVLWTWWRGARMRKLLRAAEARSAQHG